VVRAGCNRELDAEIHQLREQLALAHDQCWAPGAD
jgi:hypothetical protein